MYIPTFSFPSKQLDCFTVELISLITDVVVDVINSSVVDITVVEIVSDPMNIMTHLDISNSDELYILSVCGL